ncbi:hypothetical protein GCM10010172_56230 [Paractinoplanes ferrugineus]|uniref:Uncharacterized protein n=1 Tax=Paractinoplanes ferrugineus TaxID=113564 RepID=A0A919M8W5_9ACTN|nr:hypothetical protein [Actinoplanes ferrugineus]GIE10906.1 hypothetical protein Afe05nite_27460 [Actinoplanes ferrugineus]
MGRLLRVEALVPVTGVVAFLLLFGVLGGPGDPSPQARWVGLGVLLAPAFMAYAHRGSAAWAGVLGAVVWTSLAGSPVTALVVWAYALVAIALTRRDRSPVTAPVPRRQPPAPRGLPHVALPAEVAGFALLVLAMAGFVAVLLDRAGPPSLAAVIAAFGLGCALVARAVAQRAHLRKLFGTPQPVHAVRVVEQPGHVHVLMPEPGGLMAREFAFDVAEDAAWPDDDEDPHTLPATLYGDPRPGAWCAVQVEGRLHVPVGPVGEVIEVAYDVVQGLPREIEDDEEQLVDPEALLPSDRVDAFEPREHRIAPARAWGATVAIGLGAALAAAELAQVAGLPTAALGVATAVAAAVGYEFGWRSQLRPRLRWHVGGVAAVGFRGPDRQPWATDSAVVHDDAGTVLLTAGESVLTVPVPPPWPGPESQRSADQLVAALRDARNQSFVISPLPPPPDVQVPPRPPALYAAWLLSVALTVLILG